MQKPPSSHGIAQDGSSLDVAFGCIAAFARPCGLFLLERPLLDISGTVKRVGRGSMAGLYFEILFSFGA